MLPNLTAGPGKLGGINGCEGAERMKTIGIVGDQLSSGHRRMFAALSELFEVQFEEYPLVDSRRRPVDAWIFTCLDRESFSRMANYTVPCFAVLSSEARQSTLEKPSLIEFAKHPAVPAAVSGRQIRSSGSTGLCKPPSWLNRVTPLASQGGIPTWITQGPAGRRLHYVTESIPELSEDEPIFAHFNGNQFRAMLPLLAFLREVSEDPRWEEPPLQACFMFDDPNLHWRTYGFINYGELVKHANRYKYHISFATIPLDAWFVHKPTAALFKQHSGALSLLMHGNDHVSEELARDMDNPQRTAKLQIAIKRIQRLERLSQIDVSRVMAPPHGACSEETLGQMSVAGYLGACISSGSLRHYNRQASWVRTIGMRPCDIIRGLTVVPRFRISCSCYNSILIAAFLRQPIVPVGHHYDIAEGLELLADLSQFVNSLGAVRWGNMTSIIRSQYSKMLDGSVLRLRMHTKQAEIVVPDGVDRIAIERPWLVDEANEALLLYDTEIGPPLSGSAPGPLFTVRPGQRVRIISGVLPNVPADYLRRDGPRVWPFVRRLMTEARDRTAPMLRATRNPTH